MEETLGQVAVRNGPLIYCLESNDLPAGVRLSVDAVSLAKRPTFVPAHEAIAGANVHRLAAKAVVVGAGEVGSHAVTARRLRRSGAKSS